ncbi:kirola-like [Mangifera indica]|uniref:kirola-like n=1 Tax=Mangifera indica TaxID=29780 RepID=UPI001CFC0D86|nr:kirola-like [Mangifera indica]
MALSGQLKADVVIEAPAEKWGKDGSVYCWNYLLDGKTAYNKVKMGMDNRNKSASYKTMEGSFMNSFKSFIISFQVTPREKGSSVLWTFDYEKLNENVEKPNSLLQIVVDCCKDVGVYLNQKPP